jgi:DNA-directed RNA polymerase subunit K/omega
MGKKALVKINKDESDEEVANDNDIEVDNEIDNENKDFIDNDDVDEDEEEDEDEDHEDLLDDDNNEDTENNINKYIIEEDYEYSEFLEDHDKNKLNNNLLTKENRVSSNKLNYYELVRIIGVRVKQLTMGAKPLIKNHKGLQYERIAEEELKLNMIPFKIKRPLPTGKYEIWDLEELSKEHLLHLLD